MKNLVQLSVRVAIAPIAPRMDPPLSENEIHISLSSALVSIMKANAQSLKHQLSLIKVLESLLFSKGVRTFSLNHLGGLPALSREPSIV